VGCRSAACVDRSALTASDLFPGVKEKCEAMTTFEDLPTEIRTNIMYLRARANYKKAYRNTRSWGVEYHAGYFCVIKKAVLKDKCRDQGLHVSGTVNQLLFRIRDHKRDVLERVCNNSERFWSPVL
jgi:hypothetical protein